MSNENTNLLNEIFEFHIWKMLNKVKIDYFFY
jgi:hypothetical protein